ncbi:unnamed protein product, partial [Coregonus sp. 'balchen']
MNSSKPKNKSENKTEKQLAAEKEQFEKLQEGGATTFWSYICNLPLSSNAIISWKFCYMLHKVLRDGHHNAVKDSHRYCRMVKDMGVLWGNLHDRYGHIVALSAKFLSLKIEFHVKHKVIPGNLEATDETVEREAGTDVNKIFDMTQELLDYLDAALKMSETVWRQLDANAGKSTTPAGQCRLGPLIPVILDCSWLYHFSSPPNFLRASALAEYVRPVVVMPNEESYEEEEAEPQPDHSQAPKMPQQPYYMFSQLGAPDAGFDQRLEAELEDQRTHKQMALVDNEHLRMEVGALRQATAAIPGVQAGYQEADGRALAAELRFSQLKDRHAELVTSHAELLKKNAETVRFLSSTQQNQEELATAKQQLASEVDHLRQENRLKLEQQKQEIDRLNRELLDQRAALGEVHSALDNKELAGSQMTSALQGLQREREELLRCLREKEGEVSSLQQQAQLHHSSIEQDRDRSAREIASLKQQLHQQLAINAEQRVEIDRLKRELEQSRAETEREGLLRSVREKDAELSSLKQQAQLQHSSLEQVNDRTAREMASLRQQLQQQASREGELTRKLQEEQFCLLQCAVVEAEGIILDAVSKLDDPIHVRCTCSPEYLFSHLASDTIVNGGATAHTAPTDQADRLTDSCREASTHCLQFLNELKSSATLLRADPTSIRYVMQRILTMGQDLRLKGQDVLKEELGDMVEKEMTATSTAIEEAVLRMDEILNQARRDTSGVKLEVNQSILGSCSDLMKAIHMLVTAATDLQKDIAESSRGAASVKEFYAKNSCWTEGLISASKSVGWGATQMLDSADKVVTSGGKYEELIVCSHEIAASTAQLVAASKVKADRNNKKLSTLQQASRHVNDMAAIVVTSTNHGQRQITERDPMDFSGISLIKVKTQEIESQERVRLGELRKKHYQLSGTGTPHEGEVEGGDWDDSFPPPPPPTLLPPSTLLPQSYSQTQPYLNTQPFSQTQTNSQPSAQSYSPPKSYSQTQPYSQTKPYSEPESYSQPTTHSYSPPQSYSSSQTQSYLPNLILKPNPTHSPKHTLKAIPSLPASVPAPVPASLPASVPAPPKCFPLPNNSVELTKPTPTSKKPSIFQKTGNLFSKFRR